MAGSIANFIRAVATFADGTHIVMTGAASASTSDTDGRLILTVYSADWATVLGTTYFATANALKDMWASSGNGYNYRAGVNTIHAAMAIDGSNGIHIIYVSVANGANYFLTDPGSNQSLRYRKYTYTSGTFTQAVDELIDNTYTGSRIYQGVDIDLTNSFANPVVSWSTINGIGGSTGAVNVAHRYSTSWYKTLVSSSSYFLNYTSLAVTRSSATYGCVVVSFPSSPYGSINPATVYYLSGNSASSSAPTLGGTAGTYNYPYSGGGWRSTLVANFNATDNVFVISGLRTLDGVSADTSFGFKSGIIACAYRVSTAGVLTVFSDFISFDITSLYVEPPSREDYRVSYSVQHIASRRSLVFYTGGDSYEALYMFVTTYVMSSNVVSFSLVTPPSKSGGGVSAVFSGDRDVNSNSDITASLFTGASWMPVSRYPTTKPVLITYPTNGLSIASRNPTVQVSVAGTSNSNIVSTVHIQIATNAAFTNNLTDWYAPGYVALSDSTTRRIFLTDSALSVATYYIRARLEDETGFAYAWTSVQTFVVSSIPVAAFKTPLNGEVVPHVGGYVTFVLGKDQSDIQTVTQTALRVIISANGLSSVDTGKVVQTSESIAVSLPATWDYVSATATGTIWNEGDIASTAVANKFVIATVPIPATIWPAANGTIGTSIPTFTWNTTLGSGRTAVYFIFTITNSLGKVIYTSGQRKGVGTFTVPSGYLINSSSYTATITVIDDYGVSGSLQLPFKTSWTNPTACAAPVIDTSQFQDTGGVIVNYTCPANYGSTYYATTKLVLMRRVFSGEFSAWEIVNTSQVDGSSFYSYIDYTVPAGVDVYYVVVVSDSYSGATITGSPDASAYSSTKLTNAQYWLINPDTKTSVRIPLTSADSFTEDQEEEAYTIANRGRWIDKGEDLGYSGNLTAKFFNQFSGLGGVGVTNFLRDARMDRLNLTTKWTATLGSISTVVTTTPSPMGKSIQTALTGATSVSMGQAVSISAKRTYTCSVLVETSALTAGNTISINAAQSSGESYNYTFTEVFTLDSSLVPIPGDSNGSVTVYSSGISSLYNWYKLSATFTVITPVNKPNIKISATLSSTTVKLPIGGASLIDSSDRSIKVFDGYMAGCDWIDGVGGQTYSPGYVSARSIRKDISEIAKSTNPIYLRNPFGDVFPVNVSNIGIDRIAGTGSDEYFSMTIPYQEVADED